MKNWTGLILVGLMCSAVALAEEDHSHHAHDHSQHASMDKDRPESLKDKSIYHLSDKWTDQNGKEVELRSFKGEPVVLAMLYTSCQTACPILIADLKRIEKELGKKKVQFAVLSIDPERDTPETLLKFANTHELGPNWALLTSTPSAVRKAAAVLGVRYKKDATEEYAHSNVITLLDDEGVIQTQQVGLGQEPTEILKALK